MSLKITLKRGLDINIIGEADYAKHSNAKPHSCAIIPDDYPGFVPKPEVKEGDYIFAGSPVLRDKNNESVKLVAPASGYVKAIVRGERRKIERVVIDIDAGSNAVQKHGLVNIGTRDGLMHILQQSGLWVMLRQRPYDIVPATDKTPRDIFVTAFDSSPLAPDFDLLLNDKRNEITVGLRALAKLTDGKVYVGVKAGNGKETPIYDEDNIETVIVQGCHPAGNAGIQAANIAPVNKGEIVWTLDLLAVSRFGALLLTGIVPQNVTIAVTGSETKNPEYVHTIIGADIKSLIENNISDSKCHKRIISGNVLTGVKVGIDDYLRYPYRQITIIPEGDDVAEFMGWASLNASKMSVNRSFIGHFLKKRKFAPDARILGSRRAMIMSGEYDKVLPMDIMAEYLLKAIISRNIDDMEKLGIYEIAPEDLALCEYVDTSKIEIQKIVREGLDYLRKELE